MPHPNSGRSRAPSPPWDVVTSKLDVPSVRPGTVSRTALVNRLRAAPSPVVTLVAPGGYGKTTLLVQWAARDRRPFAWVSIDERDDDPVVLLRHLAAALARIRPLDPSVVDALSSLEESIWTAAVPRLASWLASASDGFALVLDNADLLRSRDSTKALATLADNIPSGSTLALAGRVPPRLPIARLRAGGRLFELLTDDLALTHREGEILLRETGVDLPDGDTAELIWRSEGWAAGMHLAALALSEQSGGSGSRVLPGGDDRFLADYFRSEYLSHLPPDLLTFLRRSSVLDRLTGTLCDAVLQSTESGRALALIERSGLFVVPLDRHGGSYRYHRLFQDLLRRDLTEREPELVPVLHRRAADWFEAHGDPESAFQHADYSGDTDRAARIVAAIALPAYYRGRIEAVESWLARFDDDTLLQRYPAVGVVGGWIHALRGRQADAERWLAAAELGASDEAQPDGSASVHPWVALLRAALCRDGVDQMRSDVERALVGLPPSSQWRPTALLLLGAALILRGQDELADAILARAEDAAERLGATGTRIVAISQRSLLAAAHDEHAAAEMHSLRARDVAEASQLDGHLTSAIELAASARTSLRHGRWDQARTDLTTAGKLTPLLTDALPWLAVQTRLELARAYMALRDAGGARTLLCEVLEILQSRPGLGVLSNQTAALQEEVDAMSPVGEGDRAGLTGAELRLLPLLATHLSFREIGARLFVSRNTVKTQAISVYRKLGVSNRSDAIDRAARLGLVEATSSPPAELVRTA